MIRRSAASMLLVLALAGGCAAGGGRPELRTLWDFRDLEGTEARFHEVASRARAAGDEGYALEAETQAARTLGMRGRFDEANALLDSMEGALPEARPAVRVRFLLERGRVMNSSGSGPESRALFAEAFEAAGAAGLEHLRMDAAHMMGIVEEPEAALEWAWRAMALAEASEDPDIRAWLGPLYNNTGWTLHERGEHARALALWEKGAAFREGLGEPEPIRIAWRTVATGLRSVGRTGEGLAVLERIHGIDPAANEADGYWQEEMAEHLLLLGRREEAVPHFARAHELLSGDDWLREHEAPRLERLAREGR